MAGRGSLYIVNSEPKNNQTAPAENGNSNGIGNDSSSDRQTAVQKSLDWLPMTSTTFSNSIAAESRDRDCHVSESNELSSLAAAAVELPRFTLDQLADFDGSNPNLPLYVALLGEVYDVTAGRKFYGPGRRIS